MPQPTLCPNLFAICLFQVEVSINAGGYYANAGRYWFYSNPVVPNNPNSAGIYPSLGPMAGGTIVQVKMRSEWAAANRSGANLNVTCRFGSDENNLIVQAATVDSDTLLSCVTPNTTASNLRLCLSFNDVGLAIITY